MFDPEQLFDAIQGGDTIPAGSTLVLEEESYQRLGLWLMQFARDPNDDSPISAEGFAIYCPTGQVFVYQRGREQEEGWTQPIAVENPLTQEEIEFLLGPNGQGREYEEERAGE